MSSGSVGLYTSSRSRAADRDIQRHRARQGYDGGERRIRRTWAEESTNHLWAHSRLPRQFGLREPKNLSALIQGANYPVNRGYARPGGLKSLAVLRACSTRFEVALRTGRRSHGHNRNLKVTQWPTIPDAASATAPELPSSTNLSNRGLSGGRARGWGRGGPGSRSRSPGRPGSRARRRAHRSRAGRPAARAARRRGGGPVPRR
jgi:hypothetical protein